MRVWRALGFAGRQGKEKKLRTSAPARFSKPSLFPDCGLGAPLFLTLQSDCQWRVVSTLYFLIKGGVHFLFYV